MGIKAVPVLYWYEMRWGGGKRLGPFSLWYSSTHFIYYFCFQELKRVEPSDGAIYLGLLQ